MDRQSLNREQVSILLTLEAIAAVSVAANIIQVVDFSSRIVSRSRGLYNSAEGRTIDHADLNSAVEGYQDYPGRWMYLDRQSSMNSSKS
jgi:hypothetical protein